MALARDAHEPGVPVPHRARARPPRTLGRQAADRPIASAISSWRRGCRSSCGAASPTTQLLDAAVKGRLKDPAVLEQQVRRMLADPRAEALVNNFAAQWLYLRNLDEPQARHPAVPGLRRQPAPGVPARDGAVVREHAERGPQRARSAARRLHVRQRAAREALRHSERLRQPLPAGRARQGSACAAGCSGRAAS